MISNLISSGEEVRRIKMYLKYKNSIVKLENNKPIFDFRFWFEHALWILKPILFFLMMMFVYKYLWSSNPNNEVVAEGLNQNIVDTIMMLNNNSFVDNFGTFLIFGYMYSVLKKFMNGYTLQRALIPQQFNISGILNTALNGGWYFVALILFYELLSSDQFIFLFVVFASVYFFKFIERFISFLFIIHRLKKYDHNKIKKAYYDNETQKEYTCEENKPNQVDKNSRSIKISFTNFIESLKAPYEILYTMNEVKNLIKNDSNEAITFRQIKTIDLIGVSPNEKQLTWLFKVFLAI